MLDNGGNMNLEKKRNKLFNQRRELWGMFKTMLDKYGVYDQAIMDKLVDVNEEFEKISELEVRK